MIFKQNRTILTEKLKESLSSVLPITGIVFLLVFTFVPISNDLLMAFVIGSVMLVIGMGLFTLGVDLAMTPIGKSIGADVTKTRNLWFIALVSFILGVIVTMSEPDLAVLAEQVPNIPSGIMIFSVSLGVGVFLVVAMLRIVFKINLSYLLIGLYAATFVLACFVPPEFLGVAFDSGGVTTGPMTVPVIMALGAGVAHTRSDKSAENDSFGLVALCSIGPILTVMILGLIYQPTEGAAVASVLPQATNSREMALLFGLDLPHYCKEVALALAPIIIFFLLYQIRLKNNRSTLIRIGVGVVYTFVGLVLFLTGVNVGFLPVGNYLGLQLGSMSANWLIIPVGMVIGWFIVSAEPAVHVLNKQVYEMTSGAIPQKALSTSLSVGVSLSVGLTMLRIITGVPLLYFIVPGYVIALVLTFLSPPIFTAIAFDSGGVASGAMTATFLLPLTMGVCSAVGGNPLSDAFGVVAFVAMVPLISIQILGVVFKLKTRKVSVTSIGEGEEPISELDSTESELAKQLRCMADEAILYVLPEDMYYTEPEAAKGEA